MRRRHALTDEPWELIRDHLPGKAGDPGRTAGDNRRFVDAVLYVLKTGIPWEGPARPRGRFGKPNSVWKRFDRWCAGGVWERIGRVLGDAGLLAEAEAAQLDSTTVKAHPTAATGRRERGEKKKTPTPGGAWAAPGGRGVG